MGGLYYLFFAEDPKAVCTTREDFVATSLEMVFDHKMAQNRGNKMTKSDIQNILENDPRIQNLEYEDATEEEYQAACDALSEVMERLDT
jgi:hypothetical protein